MRLINTTTLELSEFQEDGVPSYAILSHVWVEGEEVSFQDFTDLSPLTTTKSGFHKIQRACEIALRDSIEWIWIDTNCIHKASSAELIEAINSMYNWYRSAEICYAYLYDVPELDTEQEDPLRFFRQSRWLRRGWTLQELIGPRRMVFYSQTWTIIGDRCQSLAEVISSVTGVEVALLRGLKDLHEVSIAKKMSWAATRQTSRVEDMAYCLLGIFDVNMPLLYGEGAKAFVRLQEEIIRTSNDHTIFCWTRNSSVAPDWTSMLAPSPAAFLESGDYHPIGAWEAPMPYSMTNLGLSIHLPVVYTLTQMFVVLDVGHLGHGRDMRASIATERTNPRRPGSNILDRGRGLKSPIMLSKDATDTRERYHLFIRSRHIPIPSGQYVPQSTMFKHAVLLFVDPPSTKLLSTSRRGMPFGAIGYSIKTHPPGIFDSSISLLKLPAFDGGSSLFTSGLMRVTFTSPQEADFYLFFAVILTLSGKEVWHCSVHMVEEFNSLRLAIEDIIGGGELPPEILLTHQYLRSEAWENRNMQLAAHSLDESLFVSIGGSLVGQSRLDIRTAVISANSDPPLPVPLSRIRSSNTSGDEGGDYTKDSDEDEDEDEDWDSEGEEEDEIESSQFTKIRGVSLGLK